MARDADDNYYYEEGTVAEEMDNWDVYEDSDGNVGFLKGSDEVRLHELAFVMGAARTNDPDTNELAEGEGMLYFFDDGSNAVTLRVAYNDGAIQTEDLSADLDTASA